jgi:hypothetical protein
LPSGSREKGRCGTDHSVTAPYANPTETARASRAAINDRSDIRELGTNTVKEGTRGTTAAGRIGIGVSQLSV